MEQIDIAIPTFNCESWIDDLMHSIVAQDSLNWRIVLRDDGSNDNSIEKINLWSERLGNKMTVLRGIKSDNLGIVNNFNAVLSATTSRWVMTCDHDDVWLPGKISDTFRVMCEIESSDGENTPIAICTDAFVVDGSLLPVADSYWRWSRMIPERSKTLPRVAMESVALGSTMIMNRSLLNLALPIASGAPWQDWWLALVATAFGRLVPLKNKTILHRRHGENASRDPYSASGINAIYRALKEPWAPHEALHQTIEKAAIQAHAFVQRYRDSLSKNDVAALESLAGILSVNAIKRRKLIMQNDLFFGSVIKNIGLLSLV